MTKRKSGFTNHMERIIRKYKRLPITSMWLTYGNEPYRTLGYSINDKYRIIEMPFVYTEYNKFLKEKEYRFFYLNFPYYITQQILTGVRIDNDQDILNITKIFNSSADDSNYSQIEVTILESNKKWELEDKRWLKYIDNDNFEIYKENGERMFVSPNKFILERI